MRNDLNADQSKGAVATTQDVLRHHQSCIPNGDLSGLMADYAADAKFFTPDGVLRGSEAIRGFFARFLEEFAKPGGSVQRVRQDVEGDTAYVVWRGETADNRFDFATDTYFVQNGKIVTQTFAGKILPKR
jgi:ketosteroid isomerase-like protein